MLISAFFILVSLILLAYWFRYTCVLILSAKPACDYAAQVAVTNRLSFPRIQQTLEAVNLEFTPDAGHGPDFQGFHQGFLAKAIGHEIRHGHQGQISWPIAIARNPW